MRCDWILNNQEQCPNTAAWNSNFCQDHSVKRFITPDLSWTSEVQFIGKSEKITTEDRKRIDGYYNSQHPKPKKILPKPIQPIVEPEPPKRSTNVLDYPMCTIRELAEYLKVSHLTLKRWESSGKIKSIRINSRGDRRYLKEEIQRFIGEA